MTIKTPAYVSADGIQRSQADDERISLMVSALFATGPGQEVLNYLKSITISRVNGPDVTPDSLMHVEGQRYLVGLIDKRVQLGHKIKAAMSAKSAKKGGDK